MALSFERTRIFSTCSAISRSEIVGRHHEIFVDPSDRGKEYQIFWEKLRRGEYQSAEYRRIHKDGHSVWIRATYNPVLSKSGKVLKIAKFALDVTNEKLRSMEDDAILNAMDRVMGVIHFKPDGTILTANANFLKAMGYGDISELKGRHHSMFVSPEAGGLERICRVLEVIAERAVPGAEVQTHRERRTRRLDRGQLQSRSSILPVKVVKIVKFATDITKAVMDEQARADESGGK